jgi:thiol-disulfide isomerase/thioredoxin
MTAKKIPFLLLFCLISHSAHAMQNFTELYGSALEQTPPVTQAEWNGQQTLLLFWRYDCAPCLKEAVSLPDILTKHPDIPVALVALHEAEELRRHAPSLPHQVRLLVAEEDPRTLLSRFGNDRRLALPYAVLLNASGALCATHYGMISSEAISEMKTQCK